MNSLMQLVDKFIESDEGCRTDYFPWILLDTDTHVLARGGAIEKLLKKGLFSINGSTVDFGYQQQEVTAMLQHMRQEHHMYGVSKRCLLLLSRTCVPVICIVSLLVGSDVSKVARIRSDVEIYLINFIAEDCCAINV